MLFGIVGLNGSGKDTVAEYLVKKYGFEHRDLGQEIRNMLKSQGRDFTNRLDMINLGNEMRQKYGFNYWCKKAIESTQKDLVVITSVRNPAESNEINLRKGVIIEVFAEPQIRYERVIERKNKNPESHGATQSFEEFKLIEEKELSDPDPSKQQMLQCIKMSNYKLDNNGSKEHLYAQIDELFKLL